MEACINLTCSLVPLLRVLTAFQDLDDGQLGQMVEGNYSNYVVQMLLKAGIPVCIKSSPPITSVRDAETRVCWARNC